MNKALIVTTVLIVFFVLENFFPLRKRRDRINRFFQNFILSAIGFPIAKIFTYPLVLYITYIVGLKGWGIAPFFKLNRTLLFIFEFIALDYTLYWWHVANHKVRFFWRFHQVHHADRDMDTTTALRFHFGELILSSMIRCGLILIIGIRIETIIIFDILVTSFAIFHHSNFKLPVKFERFLQLLIVTPIFHQNHHSYILEETDSNYSTLFNFWDRIHHSLTRPNSPEDIIIGYPAYRENELGFLDLILMPFQSLKIWPSNFLRRKLFKQ